MSKTSAIRVCAVDDHRVVVDGAMAQLAGGSHEFEWLGSASSALDFRALVESLDANPTVALVDLYLQDGSNSFETIEWLSSLGIQVLLFTTEQRPVPLRRAILAGARGVALKSDDPACLGRMIRTLAAGQIAYSSDLAFALASDDTLYAHLTPREQEVLDLLAQGLSRLQVARALGVRQSTVDTHLRRTFAAYNELGRGVNSATGAINEARQDGYLA